MNKTQNQSWIVVQQKTRSSATADGPRDALC